MEEEVVKEELLEDPYMVDEEPGATAEQHVPAKEEDVVVKDKQWSQRLHLLL